MHLKHIIPLMYSRLWRVRWRNDVGIRFQRTPSSKKCWIIEVVEASDAIRFCTEKMIHNLPTLNFIILDTLKKTKKYVIHKSCLLLENTSKNNWDMVNCSNCHCSKNLLDTILLLLDTIRANDKKSEKWSTIKKYLPYVYFEQFHF